MRVPDEVAHPDHAGFGYWVGGEAHTAADALGTGLDAIAGRDRHELAPRVDAVRRRMIELGRTARALS